MVGSSSNALNPARFTRRFSKKSRVIHSGFRAITPRAVGVSGFFEARNLIGSRNQLFQPVAGPFSVASHSERPPYGVRHGAARARLGSSSPCRTARLANRDDGAGVAYQSYPVRSPGPCNKHLLRFECGPATGHPTPRRWAFIALQPETAKARSSSEPAASTRVRGLSRP